METLPPCFVSKSGSNRLCGIVCKGWVVLQTVFGVVRVAPLTAGKFPLVASIHRSAHLNRWPLTSFRSKRLSQSSRHQLALYPEHQARGVNGAAGLQIALTLEVLPIRVLNPGVDHQLNRAIKAVLQIQQAHHPKIHLSIYALFKGKHLLRNFFSWTIII